MYLEYYGLKQAPFDITPNPRFLFHSRKHREAYNHLLYGICERKGFVQLTGEVGAGKTTLCRALLEQLNGLFSTALILNPALDADGLMKAIATEFGLDARGRDRLETITLIGEFLLRQVQQGKETVLIIDEAQNLTEELLEQIRLLSNIETDDRKLLQIVLLGQPELRDRLNSHRLRQLRQRITVRYHLAPLTRLGGRPIHPAPARICRRAGRAVFHARRRSGAFSVTATAFRGSSTPSATRRCSPVLSNKATTSPTRWWAAPSANSKETSTYEPHQRRAQTRPAGAAKTTRRPPMKQCRGCCRLNPGPAAPSAGFCRG